MQYVTKDVDRFSTLSDQQLAKEVERLDAEIRALQGQIEDRTHTPTLPGNEEAIAKLREKQAPLNVEYFAIHKVLKSRVALRSKIAQEPPKTPIQQQIDRVKEALSVAQNELAKLEEMKP